MAKTGSGDSIAFTTASTFAPQVVSITYGTRSVPSIDITHLGSTGDAKTMGGDNPGPLRATIVYIFNARNAWPPAPKTADTLTHTFVKETTGATAATLAGTGFFAEHTPTAAVRNQAKQATVIFEFDGATGPTFTAETGP